MPIHVISPFPTHSLPRVWGWIETFRNRVVDDFSPQTLDAFVAKSMADAESMTTWAVYRDGELGGMISFQRWTPVLGTCHCLFKREMWGRKTTLPALQQIASEIFATGIAKICLCVFSDNKAIIALVKELGAVTEGHYRNHTLRNGQLVDMTAIALFKEGFENASTSNRSGNRGNLLNRGRSARGAKEDINQHEHVHAHLVAGDAGPAAATGEL
jgi:RimJ/RimL family protein N-acetyltransferase